MDLGTGQEDSGRNERRRDGSAYHPSPASGSERGSFITETLIVTPETVRLVERARRRANQGLWDGRETGPGYVYIQRCTFDHRSGARLIFTRDTGHHTSGWFKNPDYERCYHLSMSFWDSEKIIEGVAPSQSGPAREPERGEVEIWVDLFYGPWKRFVWEESPKSAEGINAGVHHYRVFCNEIWQPIIPRYEVYTREFTEKGWKSWSEQHEYPLNPEAAGTHTS